MEFDLSSVIKNHSSSHIRIQSACIITLYIISNDKIMMILSVVQIFFKNTKLLLNCHTLYISIDFKI